MAVGCSSSGASNAAPTVTVVEPSAASVVAPGTTVQIDYVDSDVGDVALTTIYADRDGDLETTADQFVIAADQPDGDGAPQSVMWDTTGYPSGTYHVIAETDDGVNAPVLAEAGGTVAINAPPTVSVTAPTADGEVRAGATVHVTYVDNDVDDGALTDLYADVDGDPGTAGDRLVIGLAVPEQNGSPQTAMWDTTAVPTGTYHICAVTNDSVNGAVTAVGSGTVTVYNPGNAIELLGDGGYVEFPEALIGDRDTFTIEFWIKPSWPQVTGAPNPWRNSVYSESAVPEGGRHHVQILSEDPTIPGHDRGSLSCEYWPPDGPPGVFSQPLFEARWQHVAVVSDQGWLRIYVDGALHHEGAAQAYLGANPTVFRIGAHQNVWGRFVLDELRVSSTARYAANFEPRLVLAADADTLNLWHFDETGGATVSDATGNAADGTLSATVARVPADRFTVSSLFDNFEDGTIDTALWEVLYPFAGSNATETGGTLDLSLRPYVATVDEWLPSADVPLVVEFDWTVASSTSHLNLQTRCDATWYGTYAEAANAVGVNFSVQGGLVWGYTVVDTVGGGVPGIDFGDHPFTFTPGTTYRIRLEDDGSSLRVFVDDMTTPLAEGTTSLTFAVNRVVFYNRELGSGADKFDNFRIAGVRSVP
ncbi:MAG: LamG-like jellyroll fold domain-containing protein [Planctomycetota bacterium]|jgi:hypothetical protein